MVGLHIAPLSGGRCSASREFTPECFALQKGSALGVSKLRQGLAEVVARGGLCHQNTGCCIKHQYVRKPSTLRSFAPDPAGGGGLRSRGVSFASGGFPGRTSRFDRHFGFAPPGDVFPASAGRFDAGCGSFRWGFTGGEPGPEARAPRYRDRGGGRGVHLQNAVVEVRPHEAGGRKSHLPGNRPQGGADHRGMGVVTASIKRFRGAK